MHLNLGNEETNIKTLNKSRFCTNIAPGLVFPFYRLTYFRSKPTFCTFIFPGGSCRDAFGMCAQGTGDVRHTCPVLHMGLFKSWSGHFLRRKSMDLRDELDDMARAYTPVIQNALLAQPSSVWCFSLK